MNDLHTPLGNDENTGKGPRYGRWIALAAVATFAGLALYGYISGSSEPTPTRVAISDAKPEPEPPAPPPSPPAVSEPQVVVVPDTDTGNAAPAAPPQPARNEPVFQPQKPDSPPRPAWVFVPELAEESDYGVLPKVSPTGLRPLDAYSDSPSTIGSVRIAIVLGGLGLSQSGTQQAIDDLPSEVTLAFSPVGNSLGRWMQVARKQGHEVALQIPMEPVGYPTVDPGRLTLLNGLSDEENRERLLGALGRMTNYPVVVNYLGGNFAARRDALEPVLREIRDRGLGFLDDGSVAASIAPDLAEELRLPNAVGNIVLDSQRNNQAIDNQLKSLELFARRRGFAIATGSVFPETIKEVRDFIRDAEKRGIQIVPLSNLIRDYSR